MKIFQFAPKTRIVISGLALTVLLSGCGSSGLPGISERVATVNGTVISKRDFDKVYDFYSKLFKPEGQSQLPADNEVVKETLKQMALNQVILNTLLRNDAEKMGIYVTDADVQKFKDERIKQLGGQENLNKYLQSKNLTSDELDDQIRKDLLVDKFLTKKAGSQLAISDADAKTYYDKNTAEFKMPERIETSHILFKVMEPVLRKELKDKNPKMTEAQINAEVEKVKAQKKAMADKVLAELKQNPSQFSELAKQDSEDTASAKLGGDLNYLTQQGTDPVFWKAIVSAKDDTLIPEPVETVFGYHIIYVKKHFPAQELSFDQAKDRIKNQLSMLKKQQILNEWVKEKKETAKIDISPKYKPKPMEPNINPGGQPGGVQPMPAQPPVGQPQPSPANPHKGQP